MAEENSTTAVFDPPAAPDTATSVDQGLVRGLAAAMGEDMSAPPADTKPEAAPAAEAGSPSGAAESNPTPEASAGTGIDDQTLQYARTLGFSEDEAKSFGTTANLQKALSAADRMFIQIGRGERPAPAATPQASAPQQAAGSLSQAVADDFAIDEATLGPEIATPLKTMKERYEGKVRSLEDRIAKFEQAMQQQSEAADLQLIASTIESLGARYVDMVKASDNPVNRLREIREDALALARGMQAREVKDIPPPNILAERAFRRVFADKIEELVRADLARQLDERKQVSTQPPVARKAKVSANPEENALNAIREKKRGYGVETDPVTPARHWSD